MGSHVQRYDLLGLACLCLVWPGLALVSSALDRAYARSLMFDFPCLVRRGGKDYQCNTVSIFWFKGLSGGLTYTKDPVLQVRGILGVGPPSNENGAP